jgi:hypothetical protein
MLLDRVMLRMESLSFPGRLLPLTTSPNKNGDNTNSSTEPIRLVDEDEDKSKCIC